MTVSASGFDLTPLTDAEKQQRAAGLTHREAAEATGWPLGTVKSHVLRGVEALRKHLAKPEVA